MDHKRISLIGCGSHKPNLAIEAWFAEQTGLLDALKFLSELLSQLGTVKSAARLRDLSHREAILPNETWWVRKFQTIRRFFQIEEYIQSITEVDSYLPTPAQRYCVENALTHFRNFESIETHLQTRGLMLGYARFVLHTFCKDHPGMAKYFCTNSTIFHNRPFKNAIFKLIERDQSQWTANERAAAKSIYIDQDRVDDEDNFQLSSYFERIEAK